MTKLPPGYSIARRKFKLGRPLAPGEESSTGLYCIATSTCSRTLRITLFREGAALFADGESRYIAECWAIPNAA